MAGGAKFPPGPKNFLGMKNVKEFKEHTLEFALGLHKNYGDIVSLQLGPFRMYAFFHPDQIKELLVANWRKAPKMPRQVKVLEQWDGNGLLLSEGDFWQQQHKLVQPAFHPKRLVKYAEIMSRHTKNRVALWQKAAGKEFTLDPELNMLALEIITESLFGGEIHSQIADVDKAVQILSEVAVAEMKMLFLPPKWLPTKHNREKHWATSLLDKTIWNFIKERRASKKDEGDLLSMLLLATDEENKNKGMTDKQARDEAMVLFLAGHDTTATALLWTFYLLGKHPEVEAKLLQEIDSVVGRRDVTFEDVSKLKYLRMVAQESMRIYPPAIGTFARENPEPITIGGWEIPAKSFLYTFSYVTHRDERWFKNPEVFDPERFSPENEKDRPQFAYFPFGAGPRMCIGMHFALTEMSVVIATILQRCRLKLVPGQNVEPGVFLSLRPKNGIRFTVEMRN